jgi:hypothetical protein
MQDILNRVAETLIEHFSGTTVGDGGTWSGSGTTSFSGTDHGPFPVLVNVNQWETTEVQYPSVNMTPVLSEPMGRDRINNSGGLHRAWVRFRVSVDQQKHGQSVAGVLTDELINFLRTTHFQPSGTGKTAYVTDTDFEFIPDGQLLHYDSTPKWKYYF